MYDIIAVSEIGASLALVYGITINQLNERTILLTGDADQQDYSQILSEIHYENTAEEPGDVVRQVSFTIRDVDGFFASATTVVEVISTNDQPIITFFESPRVLVYDEFIRQPINIFNDNDTISDSDGDSLQWLSVAIIPGVHPNDTLRYDTGNTGLIVSTTSPFALNITGNASLKAYESVIRTISFVNAFPGLSGEQRIVQVVMFDGETESVIQIITITIDLFNDVPMCFFNQLVRLASL